MAIFWVQAPFRSLCGVMLSNQRTPLEVDTPCKALACSRETSLTTVHCRRRIEDFPVLLCDVLNWSHAPCPLRGRSDCVAKPMLHPHLPAGFDLKDALALVRMDNLYIETFEIKDVKVRSGNLARRARSVHRVSQPICNLRDDCSSSVGGTQY